ncbi:DNA recombination protein RmuC [Sphingorhabdus contaminans]|uniref:DNA recombination protein RmuC n=1 Tax=Sphingorhabdus contaminans TaxID=1343899 RepID=UPI003D2C3CAD
MEPLLIAVVGIVALLLGLAIGWFAGGRSVSGGAETVASMRLSLDSVIAERDEARIKLAQVETALTERERAFEDQLAAMAEAKEILAGQFSEISQKLLHEAQSRFLQRADERFKESETVAGQRLSALLQPVHDRLEKYETAVGKVEAERREAFGNLHGLMESMRVSTEAVKTEAQRLGNSLRNAPKARGRWGEQQLRNVLESCGLSEHADFQTEVSMEGSEGRLRPDVILRVPGGRNLVIDAKVSLNAYQDAFEAGDEHGRENSLAAHAAAMKSHVNSLGQKAYQDQFEDTPDYVIMFVPGEHFLAAALEKDPDLWDFAFSKRVLLATPTNLIAIARTVAAVWKQEKMAGQAREIAELGKELYARLTTMGAHVGRMGKNLDTAVSAYNALVGSLESQVLTQAKRFEDLSVDTGGKSIEMLPVVDQTTRPMVKLVESAPKNEDAA